MNTACKIIGYLVVILIGLMLGLIIFLFIYYEVQENKLHKRNVALEQKEPSRLIQADSIAVDTSNHTLNLIPVPQRFQIYEGVYHLPEQPVCSVTDSMQQTLDNYMTATLERIIVLSSRKPDMEFIYSKGLPDQGYTLDIQPDKIKVEYSTRQGLYYALVSIKVLHKNYAGNIPCVFIEDYPDLAVRGLMLDISRDKVPTLNTLRSLVQLLADLKYNHLELYVEGFSFAYPSYQHLWMGKETPITGEEIKILDALCKANFIDLVPNHNTLGHMMAWLNTDQFMDLAECPDGYKIMGLINMKGTLDPSDPRSLELVTTMTDDLLPNFSSDKFNVNLDEPFELGKGKSKKLAKESGVEHVYLDYAMKIHDMVTSRNKEMLMWGDIVLRHPQIIKRLPKDITLLDWGYESSYPFTKNCKTLQSSGLNYWVCPGTSSWTSITGRTDNMLGNIAVATTNAVKYGAQGMLLTDWGDMGNWQYLPVSYAGYTAGAALSWNSKSFRNFPLTSFLNTFVFQDERQIMGNLVLDMGRYKQFEEIPVPNMTTTMLALQFGMRDELLINAIYDKIAAGILEMMKDLAPELIAEYQEQYDARQKFDFPGMITFLDEKEALLNNISLKTADSLIIVDEYRNAARLIRVGVGLQYYIQMRRNMTPEEEKKQMQTLQSTLQQYLHENQRLWLLRNNPGGYERSTAVLKSLLEQIEKRIVLLGKSRLKRAANRFFEKVVTAGVILYLNIGSS